MLEMDREGEQVTHWDESERTSKKNLEQDPVGSKPSGKSVQKYRRQVMQRKWCLKKLMYLGKTSNNWDVDEELLVWTNKIRYALKRDVPCCRIGWRSTANEAQRSEHFITRESHVGKEERLSKERKRLVMKMLRKQCRQRLIDWLYTVVDVSRVGNMNQDKNTKGFGAKMIPLWISL